MSRKPVDKQQPSECRQAIWEWIRSFAKPGEDSWFHVRDIDVVLEDSSIRDYLAGLAASGYLERRLPTKRGEKMMYRFVKDAGHHAPRVRKDGSEVIQGRSRLYMWRAMPVIKVFTSLDLAYNASTPEHTVSEVDAKDYIGHLAKAGYLIPAGGQAKPGHKQAYRVKPGMWTGPHPPQIQRTKQIYDPNLQRVVWSTVTGGAE
jgi:hypothetical protein